VARKLKVYRTAIGFYDAYVAAPSMKAALAAWGTDKNLFARGVAEQVTDPKLAKAALARPGEVVKVPRGSPSEHVKALGAMPKRAKADKQAEQPRPAKRTPAPREKPPKPSRDQLRFAEAALAGAKKRARERLAELAAEERALAAERKRAERQLVAETARFEKRLEEARKQYDKAVAIWRKG